MTRYLASAGLLAMLAACSDTSGPVSSPFFREAGSQVDTGHFGNATANNMAVMAGERDFVIDLNRRFAAQVPTTINFAFDSAQLSAEARAALAQQAQWIRQFPEVHFRVYGHTDLVGSDAYNRRLGLRRAQAAVAFLTSQGISRARLEAVVSYGETQPLIYTEDPARINRRTVTEVSGLIRSHPTVMDGKYAAVIYREYIESAVPPSGLTGIEGVPASE